MAWLVAYAEPSRELLACERLIEAGIEAFCPVETVRERRRVRGNVFKIFVVKKPLWGRYVLVRDEGDVPSVARAWGVARILGTSEGPVRMPDGMVDLIRAELGVGAGEVRDTVSLAKKLGWSKGDTFRLGPNHPLAGFLACISSVARLDKTGCVAAWVNMFGREHRVSVPWRDVVVEKRAATAA